MKIVKTDDGMAKIYTPYNADFVKKIKCVGGRKWDDTEKCWIVPETEIDVVRQHMMEVYGETDLPDEDKKVTVKVVFKESAREFNAPIVLFGKEIARARGRDSGATIGADVTLISGKIDSGGSRINWVTKIEEGSVFKIRHVPRRALTFTHDYDITVEELEEPQIDRKALEEEKAKLLARLAEIEELLV